ncbi:hypothetical protein, partial [Azospirillum sp. B4]|uniref:hypothetical protein n=1 Tax=Azospirillum sp. B4 TaxID=95605 RepID=UPI0011DC9F61
MDALIDTQGITAVSLALADMALGRAPRITTGAIESIGANQAEAILAVSAPEIQAEGTSPTAADNTALNHAYRLASIDGPFDDKSVAFSLASLSEADQRDFEDHLLASSEGVSGTGILGVVKIDVVEPNGTIYGRPLDKDGGVWRFEGPGLYAVERDKGDRWALLASGDGRIAAVPPDDAGLAIFTGMMTGDRAASVLSEMLERADTEGRLLSGRLALPPALPAVSLEIGSDTADGARRSAAQLLQQAEEAAGAEAVDTTLTAKGELSVTFAAETVTALEEIRFDVAQYLPVMEARLTVYQPPAERLMDSGDGSRAPAPAVPGSTLVLGQEDVSIHRDQGKNAKRLVTEMMAAIQQAGRGLSAAGGELGESGRRSWSDISQGLQGLRDGLTRRLHELRYQLNLRNDGTLLPRLHDGHDHAAARTSLVGAELAAAGVAGSALLLHHLAQSASVAPAAFRLARTDGPVSPAAGQREPAGGSGLDITLPFQGGGLMVSEFASRDQAGFLVRADRQLGP